jgi:hypothetical protein
MKMKAVNTHLQKTSGNPESSTNLQTFQTKCSFYKAIHNQIRDAHMIFSHASGRSM